MGGECWVLWPTVDRRNPPRSFSAQRCCYCSLCPNPDSASTRGFLQRQAAPPWCRLQKVPSPLWSRFFWKSDPASDVDSLTFPGVRSVRSACAPSELFMSKRHPGSVQDPLGDLLVGGEVPQAVSTVAPPCSVVKDCWWVFPFFFSQHLLDYVFL